MQVPNDVVIRAFVKIEYSQIRFGPRQPIIALGIAEQVADVAAPEMPSVIVGAASHVPGSVSSAGAGHIQTRDAVSVIRIHASHIPHLEFVRPIVVQHGSQEIDPLGSLGTVVFPGLAGLRRQDRMRCFGRGVERAGDAMLAFNECVVNE